jgi:GH18 family chitinase
MYKGDVGKSKPDSTKIVEERKGDYSSTSIEKKIVLYFAEWAIYDRNHLVSELPARQITHINYAFAQIS